MTDDPERTVHEYARLGLEVRRVRDLGDGKSQTMITLWDNGGGQPDLDNTTQFFYADSSRNYSADADLTKWTNDGARELDPQKRGEIYQKLFNKVIDERYGMPLVELPALLIVSKDMEVDTNHMKPEGFVLNRLSWAK